MTDEDLVYDGRARKRPPGANSTAVEIFDLLDAHPEGISLEEMCAKLQAGFPTDAYRAYDKDLQSGRERREKARGSATRAVFPPPRLQYGTTEFKRRAERWWVQKALRNMMRDGSARREGDVWFQGERSPLVQIVCEAGHRHMVPYDSKSGRAEDEARVRRANLREDARTVLADKRLSAKARRVIEQLLETT